MPSLSSRASVPVETLREAVKARVGETSQRQTAKEVGISPTAIRGFLSGAEPYGRNLMKLSAWYKWTREGVELGELMNEVGASLAEDRRQSALTELRRIVRDWAERWREQ